MRHNPFRLFLPALAGLATLSLSSCKSSNRSELRSEIENPSAIFADNSILKVEIRGPFEDMFAIKDDRSSYVMDMKTLESDPPWFAESVQWKLEAGQSIPAKLRVRGNIRRGTSFPPLKIKIAKKDAKNTPLEGHSSFKIITHSEADADPMDMHHEYSYYGYFQAISDIHFKVRLMNVTYTDTKSGKVTAKPAVLLEEPEIIAKRVAGFDEIELTSLEQAMLMPEDGPSQRAPGQERDPSQPQPIGEERWEGWLGAIYNSELVKAIDAERKIRLGQSGDKDAVEQSLAKDRAQIWKKAGLMDLGPESSEDDFKKAMVDAEKLSPALRSSHAKRMNELRRIFDGDQVARIILFETLISNNDWSIFGRDFFKGLPFRERSETLYNMKLIGKPAGPIVPVPYDLNGGRMDGGDLAEFSSTLDMVLKNLSATTVPTRNQFLTAIAHVRGRKAELLKAAQNPHLDARSQELAMKTVNVFMEVLAKVK